MARVLQLKLQGIYCPRLLASPALASKVLDPRHIPWKFYGGSALLEESCNSTLNSNDIDGDSKAANGGVDSVIKGDKVEDKASKEADLDKLTNSICNKLWAKANVVRGEKDKGFLGDTKETKKTDNNDQWQQVVSTVRSMVLKSKAKALAGDKLGVQKTQLNEDLHNFSDLDSPEAVGEFGYSGGINSPKDLASMNTFGKSLKQKTSQSQFSNQQRPKDTKPLSFLSLDNSTPLSSLMSPDEVTFTAQTEISKIKIAPKTDASSEDFFSVRKPNNLRDRNQLQGKDATPGGVGSKMLKGRDTTLPQAAEDGSSVQTWNRMIGKEAIQGISDFKAKGSDDAPLPQLHGKIPSYVSDATSQPSSLDNKIPQTGYMVCVHNLPSSCNPAAIKSTMAVHGEVSGLFKKAIGNDYYNVYILFKTAHSVETAIAAGKLFIGGKQFLIARTDQVVSSVVRLTKVGGDTTEKQVLSICEKYGSVDNIRKRINGVFDVYYQVKELPNMRRILESLNEVTVNRGTWFAIPAPTLHPSVQKEVMKSPEGQAWHDIQVSQALGRIESGIDGVSVLFEDLRELNALGKDFSRR